MKYQYLYLRSDTRESIFEALVAADLATKVYEDHPDNTPPEDAPEDWAPSGPYDYRFTATGSLDDIGTIYRPTGTMLTDDEGIEYPEMAPIDGYHINLALRPDVDVSGLPVIAEPTAPYRKWSL